MMFCKRHACRSGPTNVAHFDFELPDACPETPRDGISFSGIVEMCVIREKRMMLTHVDMYAVSVICFHVKVTGKIKRS